MPTPVKKKSSTAPQPGILMRSMPLDGENSLDSFDEESDDTSEELDVTVDDEDIDYEKHIVLGKLSRNSNRMPIWQSKLDAYFVIAQLLISCDTVFAFAVSIEKYGFIFLPAYITCTLLVGFPLLYLELALGQFTSCNVFTIFRRMAPAAAGIGIAALIGNALAMLTGFMRIVTFLQIFVEASNPFTNAYPWTSCSSPGDSKHCTERAEDCNQMTISRGDIKLPTHYNYMAKQLGVKYSRIGETCVRTDVPVIQDQFKLPDDLFYHDPMVTHLFPNLSVDDLTFKYYPSEIRVLLTIFAWLAILALAHKNRTVMVTLARISTVLMVSGMATMTSILPYVRSSTISLHSLMGAGANKGFSAYIEPQLWMEAVLLTMRTLKLGQGTLPYLASQNEFRNNIFWDAAILVLCAVIIPFVSAVWMLVVIDSYRLTLAYSSHELFSKIREIHKTNHVGVVIIAVLATSMQVFQMFAPFCLLVLSSFIILSIVTNCIIRVDIMVSSIVEIEGSFRDHSTRGILINQVIVVAAFLGMAFYSTDGFKLLLGVDDVLVPVLTSFVVLAEIAVLGFLYGTRRFFANVSAMNRSKAQNDFLHNWIMVMMTFDWMIVAPGFVLFATIVCLHESLHPRAGESSKIEYYIGAVLVSCVIPTVVVSKWTEAKAKAREWTQLFEPDPDLWGPRSAVHRELNDRLERKIKPFQVNLRWLLAPLQKLMKKDPSAR